MFVRRRCSYLPEKSMDRIVGSLCAGKHTVAKWLISTHGFIHLALSQRDHFPMVPVEFDSPVEMLQHVTKNWSENFVTCDIETIDTLELFRKRPFFLLISVDSPVMMRYARYLDRFHKHEINEPTLEEFVIESDRQLYQYYPISSLNSPLFSFKPLVKHGIMESPISDMMNLADINVINPFSALLPFYARLHNLGITNPERLRPSWDTYFMHMSDLAARRSNCMKRKVGCVLVKDCRVIATGYNGTPRGLKNCNEGGCQRCNAAVPCGHALDTCLCLHAEENALLEAGRERVGNGCTLYCNT
ncbi:hypothetical protein G9A89_020703 [Geosiphon pyriformis]|nr:hypothetical protein G9A89_020703 [Geosiphon pyriformis]